MISLARSLMVFAILNIARASLYVTFPAQGDTCTVSQPCQIKWKDDSRAPSTSTIGETTIDLVMGSAANLQPVQNLGGVSNPGAATAITFTPNSGLSPTQQYAVRFISKGNASNPIFSTFFSITGGSGTAKPLTTNTTTTTNTTNNSSSASPAPIIGNKSLNGPTPANTTSGSNVASDKASKSGSSTIRVPFHAMAVVIGLCALFKAL